MRKLALTLSALGFIAFAGIAHADQKTENTQSTDSSNTLGGKHKVTRTRKIAHADGTTVEKKVETTTPKQGDQKDINANDSDRNTETKMDEKTERKDTLGGKHETKTTKTMDEPNGSEVKSTTTTDVPKNEPKNENK